MMTAAVSANKHIRDSRVIHRCFCARPLEKTLYLLFSVTLVFGANTTYVYAAKTKAKFVDITETAKVGAVHHAAMFDDVFKPMMNMYNAILVGAAIADYNNDGYLDIYMNDTAPGTKNHLFRNNGDLTFTDVSVEAGVAFLNDKHNVSTAAIFLDYDGDYKQDLLVARFGTPVLLRNKGDGTFEDVSEKAGIKRHMNTFHVIAFDYNRDGHIDLYFGNYFQNDIDMFDIKTKNVLHDSWEDARNGGENFLYHNNGDGTFTDKSKELNVDDPGFVVAVGHGDYDNDGWQDLYLANDYGPDKVLRNTGKGKFEDVTDEAIGHDGKHGMNAEFGDFNNDGFLDIYVTNITEEWSYECNMLWQNNTDGTFTDVALELNVCDTGWGWGAKFFDYDNDTDLDLYVANGMINGEGSYAEILSEFVVSDEGMNPSDPSKWPEIGKRGMAGNERNQLFTNLDGLTYVPEKDSGLNVMKNSRAILLADFDNDGWVDTFITNSKDAAMLFVNKSHNGNRWLQIDLIGKSPNTNAVGARLEIKLGSQTFIREVNIGNGLSGSSMLRQHFGLGKRDNVDKLTIRWPNGDVQEFKNITGNQIISVTQGDKILRVSKSSPSKQTSIKK